MISKNGLQDYVDFVEQYGTIGTAMMKDVSVETVKNHLSRAKSLGIEPLKSVPKTNLKRYVVLGCVHVPFHNKLIIDGIKKMMTDNQFDGIVLAGDFLDMNALGSYEKGKVSRTGITLADEYAAANELLDEFDKLLPDGARKVFMFGNHEDRYWRWKADVDNSKYGDIMCPIAALGLVERGYEVYEDYAGDFCDLGSLHIMHGEYYNVHSAKKHLDVFRRNVLYFHTHRVQLHREGEFAAYNCGFLGNVNAPCFSYAKRGMKSAWANGFAVVTLDDSNHYVQIINCVKDKFIFNGIKYGK